MATTLGKLLPQFVCDMLAHPPRRGEGLNLWLFRVARVMHPYRTPIEIVEILRRVTAGEAVKPGEIERAVLRSGTVAWRPGQLASPRLRSEWPNTNFEQREAIIAGGFGLTDLWENSPLRFEDDTSHTEHIIDALFPSEVLLCCGRNSFDFATVRREEWRGRLSGQQLIVPSPMVAQYGRTQDGKRSEHALSNTGSRRFLVVEQDTGTVDEQAAILAHLAERAPLALAVYSGGKSIHGWFFCDRQPEERLLAFMRYAVSLGADRATWTRCQFVRMPDGTRDDGHRQTVYFFNPRIVK